MKTSEEMSKSVLEKVRAYEVHRAAVRKRVTALSVSAAALAIVIFAGAAVTGNLGMGAKSEDSVAREDNDIEYGIEIDPETDANASTEYVNESSASKSESAAEDPSGAGDVISLSYNEFNALLPAASPLKDLEDKGFSVSECSAQFRENENGGFENCPVYAFADFAKDNISGTVFCDFAFTGTLDDYTASHPLSFRNAKKIRCGETQAVFSADEGGGYVALFETGGCLYKINVGGIGSPEELQTFLTDLIHE